MMQQENHEQNQGIDNARNQVNEVLDVMRNNVTKMMERENKLVDLDSRATNLEQSSIQFSTTARRVRKKYWWENFKMKLCIGGTLLVLLIIIIIIIVYESRDSSGSGNSDSTTVASI